MTTTKLTLSIDKTMVKEAKRLAHEQNTSVSAMFTRFISALGETSSERPLRLGPVTLRASGLVSLPENNKPEKILTDALMEKYSLDK